MSRPPKNRHPPHRERNREHAKRSRIRKKFLLESLQQSVSLLREENDKLRDAVRTHLADEAEELLRAENLTALIASDDGGGGEAGGVEMMQEDGRTLGDWPITNNNNRSSSSCSSSRWSRPLRTSIIISL